MSVKKSSGEIRLRPNICVVIGIESKLAVNDTVGVGLPVVRELLSINLVTIPVYRSIYGYSPISGRRRTVQRGLRSQWSLVVRGRRYCGRGDKAGGLHSTPNG